MKAGGSETLRSCRQLWGRECHFWGGEAQTSNLCGNGFHLSARSWPLAVPFPQGWWLCPGLHLSATGTCSQRIFVLLFSTPIFPAQIFLWPFPQQPAQTVTVAKELSPNFHPSLESIRQGWLLGSAASSQLGPCHLHPAIPQPSVCPAAASTGARGWEGAKTTAGSIFRRALHLVSGCCSFQERACEFAAQQRLGKREWGSLSHPVGAGDVPELLPGRAATQKLKRELQE